MAFWWVNHRKTRDHEVSGGYLWSPMRKANNTFNQTYENMTRVRRGDVVFSYAKTRIGAIGVVTEAASASPKPDEFGGVGDNWSHEGWLVQVYFSPAPKALYPKQNLSAIAPLLPSKYSPIRSNGDGNENCYLAEISESLGRLILALMGAEAPDFLAASPLQIEDCRSSTEVLEDLSQIGAQTSISETQRLQLTKARIGQGLFRNRVLALGPHCRVTGVEDPRLLIASHIKPWRESSNAERIDGYNGLTLSPHVDALFDDQLMAFEDDGTILIHASLPRVVLERWALNVRKVEAFRPEQARFLEHHRKLFAKRAS